MSNLGKSFALLLVVLFLTSSVRHLSAPVKANPKTIIVPTDYPTIQSAIGNASAGDTIFVKKGTYYLPPFTSISKPLSIIGEERHTTIIDGKDRNSQANAGNQVTFQVGAPDVTISDFTITDCNIAIDVVYWISQSDPSRCKIIDNIFYNNAQSISIGRSSDFQIRNNYVNGSDIGISDGPELFLVTLS